MPNLTSLLNAASKARIEPEARPFQIDVPGAREAFLLLHGYTGIPRELYGMGEALAKAGYSSRAPRYPGHGTCRADFLASGAADWVRRAMDSYQELRAEFDAVHVLGHSMGGLIAAAAAAAFGAPKLILLAPAFKLTSGVIRMTPFLAPFFPVLHRNRPLTDEETDPVRRRLFADYWADDLVSGAAHLQRIRKTATDLLPTVRSSVLVIIGSSDQTVPPSVGDYLKGALIKAASCETRMLEGAGHRFPFDKDSGRAAAIVREWVVIA